MSRTESFNPNIIIVEHFDKIKNNIDVITETLLCNQNLNEAQRKILNDLRQEKLDKIDEIKDKTLARVNFDEFQYLSKWTHVIDDATLSFEEKCERIKESLIGHDCFLMHDNHNLIFLIVSQLFTSRD
jgi:hypothetical protein